MTNEAITALYIVAAAMLMIGVLIIFFDRRKRARCTEETTATIVSVGEDVSRDGSGHKERSYTAFYEFTVRGATVRRQGGSSTSRKRKYKRGETRQVKYNPDNPNEFVVVGDSGNSGGGIALIFLAVVIAGIVLAAQLGAFNGLIK